MCLEFCHLKMKPEAKEKLRIERQINSGGGGLAGGERAQEEEEEEEGQSEEGERGLHYKQLKLQ